jgi:UDP-N-acetylmuramoylalanine--D-glutamate ligase
VLFSPAASSFDQFRDFEHRGEVFRELVRALPGLAPIDPVTARGDVA